MTISEVAKRYIKSEDVDDLMDVRLQRKSFNFCSASHAVA